MSISRKVYGALGVILLLFIVVFAIALSVSGAQLATFKERYRNDVAAAVHLSRAQDALWRLRYGFPQFMVNAENSPERAKILADEPTLYKTIEEALGSFERTGLDEQEKRALESLRTVYRQYAEARPRWFQLVGEGKHAEAAEWRARTTTPFGAATVKGFGELLELDQGAAARHIEEMGAAATRTAFISLATFLAGVLLAIAAGTWLVRAIVPGLREARGAAERIAQGDLTGSIQSRSRDETGQLLGALNAMNAALASLVTKVRASANMVSTASTQVAAGTGDLSQRTEEQASSLEETAASMEELASTVKQSADNARQADQVARSAAERAEKGGTEVRRAVSTMNEIAQSSTRIADIINVMDGITFQTNILALNAAVEAARAGEQGRGFAVVAAEVRSLAQRSSQAAKEIKDLIGASVAKAEAGTRVVEEAGATIDALVSDVKQVSVLMGQIAEASAEQSRGVQQINKTVTEMDKVVQQNASAVQQSAAAAENMRSEAEKLVEAVSSFRTDGLSQAAEAAPTPALVRHGARPGLSRRPAVPALATALASGGAEEWKQF